VYYGADYDADVYSKAGEFVLMLFITIGIHVGIKEEV